MHFKQITYIAVVTLLAFSCRKAGEISEADEQDWYAGGSQTVFMSGAGAYSQPFPTLSESNDRIHEVGDIAFEATFVSAPNPKNPGLGPVFNNVSCFSCHISDGRGKAPEPGQQLVSMLFRLSVDGEDEHGGPLGAPLYGGQLQPRGIVGTTGEGDIDISYSYDTYYFPDGESYELRTPTYTVYNFYTGVPAGLMISPRVAPPVFGMGLLEAVSEATILSRQDINDADGDGISGKANYVWNIQKNQSTIGKFGWKANSPNLIQQIAAAYNQDMGITNFLFPQEACFGQSQYDGLLDDVELSDSLLYATTFYMRTVAVPARRNVKDAEVIRGKQVFYDAKCTSCHTPKMRTGVNVAFPDVSNQLIFPYTDLLVHDMGSALADERPDYLANGNEWRTPPLWGIGLTQVVNGHTNFLHDGRARNLIEAIMWHGGEGEQAKQYVKNLSTYDRNALIKFLQSL